ncbi:MAG TPA: DUF2946 family protein [Hydrogenophaga sp.]|nr:DUF2946 family protein [Hydrogenophaga sp.]
MDDIVKAAMAKWPNVPHCYGWLGLDARGQWYMRDDRIQAIGPFAALPGEDVTVSKGSLLKHDKLVEFIHRNYAADDSGHWFFQNGPQRVYVELEAAPFVWRLSADGSVHAHTGELAQVQTALVDEAGHLYLATNVGFGLVHTADMLLAADHVDAGRWQPETVRAADLPKRFGFEPSPQRRAQSAAGN